MSTNSFVPQTEIKATTKFRH